MKLDYKAGDLAKTPVVIDRSARVKEAASLILNQGLDVIIVADGGKPVGAIGHRDIIWGMVYRGVGLEDSVDKVVNRNPPSVTADSELGVILDLMTSSNERYVLVYDGDRLVGVVDAEDLLDLFRNIVEIREVKEIKGGKR